MNEGIPDETPNEDLRLDLEPGQLTFAQKNGGRFAEVYKAQDGAFYVLIDVPGIGDSGDSGDYTKELASAGSKKFDSLREANEFLIGYSRINSLNIANANQKD